MINWNPNYEGTIFLWSNVWKLKMMINTKWFLNVYSTKLNFYIYISYNTDIRMRGLLCAVRPVTYKRKTKVAESLYQKDEFRHHLENSPGDVYFYSISTCISYSTFRIIIIFDSQKIQWRIPGSKESWSQNGM